MEDFDFHNTKERVQALWFNINNLQYSLLLQIIFTDGKDSGMSQRQKMEKICKNVEKILNLLI